MGLLEPRADPELARALGELFIIFGVIVVCGLVITISSVVGVIRAVRRQRRGGRSLAAVLAAAIATAVASCWLLYWVGDDIHNRANPINGLFAINLVLCLPPLSWLVAAIRANARSRDETDTHRVAPV